MYVYILQKSQFEILIRSNVNGNLKFLPGKNNETYNTSGKSEFIWFSSYTEISARVEITIQSLAAAGYRSRRAYELNLKTTRRLEVGRNLED